MMSKGMFYMQDYLKKMSYLFMVLAAAAAVTVGLSLNSARNFSARMINYLFPLDCRIEYLTDGKAAENALVTLNGSSATIKSKNSILKTDIDSIIITDNIKSQRTQNAARVFLLFSLIMLISLLIPFSLAYVGICCHLAYTCHEKNIFQKNFSAAEEKSSETDSISAVA